MNVKVYTQWKLLGGILMQTTDLMDEETSRYYGGKNLNSL
jgi:hypothetical protein